jgi:sterol desaturase/sphingolipid hydroxylase (fatty acid hydroxylase superfamily)
MTSVPEPALLKATAALLWFATLFAAERLWPAAPRPMQGQGWRRLARNLGLWGSSAVLSALAVVPLTLSAGSHALSWRPDWWSGPLAVAADLLVLDLWIYVWHRANHRLSALWRFHEVHHLDRFLDTTSAGRFHAGEVLLSALARMPLLMIAAIPLPTLIAYEALVQIAALFHHSNIRLPAALERSLARVIITPSLHWVHHHRRQSDTDSTYGTVLSVWDRLFGSAVATPRTPDMEIGVESRDERSFAGLLLRPFTG